MNRSIENRILGGVCGGLGAATPLSATVWRIVFALITAMTFGFGLLVYALWWWLIPQDTAGSEGGSIYSMLLAGGMSVILLGGWFLRERLVGPEGASLLLPFIVLIVGFVLLYKQITAPIGVPISPMSVVVMLAVAVAWMLSAIGLLPTVVQDALLRAAPALLIFLGLVWMLPTAPSLGGAGLAGADDPAGRCGRDGRADAAPRSYRHAGRRHPVCATGRRQHQPAAVQHRHAGSRHRADQRTARPAQCYRHLQRPRQPRAAHRIRAG